MIGLISSNAIAECDGIVRKVPAVNVRSPDAMIREIPPRALGNEHSETSSSSQDRGSPAVGGMVEGSSASQIDFLDFMDRTWRIGDGEANQSLIMGWGGIRAAVSTTRNNE